MIAIIVQARMGSTRLPGKVLKPIGMRPMLLYQLERLRRVALAQQIVVATTMQGEDDAIVRFCAAEGVSCTRGSESDVLLRYHEAASKSGATVIVRVTSDCPLIDPELIDHAIATYLEAGQRYDYVSNMLEPTWPYGMAVEVLSSDALATANRHARDPSEREHVTPYIYWRPREFRIRSLTREPNLSHHRWTVDTPEDFDLISRIIAHLYARRPDFGMTHVLQLLDRNPDWLQINSHVPQRRPVGNQRP
jgi:spore coat polysaccharide biosynthesis protein SpsF